MMKAKWLATLIYVSMFFLCGCGGGSSSGGVASISNGNIASISNGNIASISNGNIAPVSNGNIAPVANAGVTQNVVTGTVVTLNGSASSDANGDPLTYRWTLTSKPVSSTAALSTPTVVNPTFTPDIAGSYVLSLIVNDGSVSSVVSTVDVIVTADTVLWGLGSVNGDIYQTAKPVYIQNYGYVRNVAHVAGGYSHILVLFNDGTLAGWGSNQFGQIGVSNYSGGLEIIAHDVIAIAAGYYHTVFLKSDGTVWASGLNSYGQLGDGSLANKNVPVQIASGVLSVSASDYATSILKQDGTLWRTDVINNPTPGQQGQFSQQASNVKVIPSYGYKPIYVTSADVLVDSGSVVDYNVTALTATFQNVYYITKDGMLYGYGENYSGQLGNGTNVGTTIPIVIANSISGVGATSNMAWFIDNNGDLYGTGDNRWGIFNPDTNSFRYVWTPVLISDSVKAIFSSAPDSYVIFFLKDY